MKKVVSILLSALLMTFFFSACADGAQDTVTVTQPTSAPGYTETETLYYRGYTAVRQSLELDYDGQDILTQERRWQYYESGVRSAYAVTEYDAGGNVTAYQEKQYDKAGALAMSLVKDYDGGIPVQQEEIFYYEDETLRSYDLTRWDESGTVLRRECYSHFADGTLASRGTELLDEWTGMRIIEETSYYEDGTLASSCDGFFHAESYELLSGKTASYDSDGALRESKEAVWDEESRTRNCSYFQYAADGSEQLSYQITELYDIAGNILVYEYASFGKDHAFGNHYIENRTFDTSGKLTQNAVQYYLSDGSLSEYFEHLYEYDAAGDLVMEQSIHDLSPGVRQNLTVTAYTYDEAGNLLRMEQTGYESSGARKFQQIKEYDAYGNLITFVTVSSKGARSTQVYTYDEEGRIASELVTTVPVNTSRITYQETFYEYYENGSCKTVAVHTWTSTDEAKAAPGTSKFDLGTTTVTEYDEAGNEI